MNRRREALLRDYDRWEKASAKAQDQCRQAGEALKSAEAEEALLGKQVDALRDQYRQERETLTARAGEAGFADIGAFEAYFGRLGEEEALRKRLTDYQAQVTAEADKAAAERKTIGDAPKPDMDRWNAAEAEASGRTKRALEERTRLESTLSLYGATKKAADRLLAEQQENDRNYALAGRLAGLFRGDENGVNLERFVLGALLDDVLIRANLRLKTMSGGRYQLSRRAEREDRRKKSGLDLDVFDSYTGQARPANTLRRGDLPGVAVAGAGAGGRGAGVRRRHPSGRDLHRRGLRHARRGEPRSGAADAHGAAGGGPSGGHHFPRGGAGGAHSRPAPGDENGLRQHGGFRHPRMRVPTNRINKKEQA